MQVEHSQTPMHASRILANTPEGAPCIAMETTRARAQSDTLGNNVKVSYATCVT